MRKSTGVFGSDWWSTYTEPQNIRRSTSPGRRIIVPPRANPVKRMPRQELACDSFESYTPGFWIKKARRIDRNRLKAKRIKYAPREMAALCTDRVKLEQWTKCEGCRVHALWGTIILDGKLFPEKMNARRYLAIEFLQQMIDENKGVLRQQRGRSSTTYLGHNKNAQSGDVCEIDKDNRLAGCGAS